LLRGHPQIAYYGLLMLALFGVVEIIGGGRDRAAWPDLWRFAAAARRRRGLGFALGAVLLLPVRGYAPESIRGRAEGGGASYEFATGWSQVPWRVGDLRLAVGLRLREGTYVGDMPFTNFPHYLGALTLLGAPVPACSCAGGSSSS